MPSTADLAPRRPPRARAFELVESIGGRIRDGRIAAGEKLPTEAEIMAEFGVSRTVVREALSRLQALALVRTRHGIGTFALGPPADEGFRVEPQQLETLRDVVAMLELRIGIETEAAALAAQRRTAAELAAMRAALDDFARALDEGRDAAEADFRFHAEIARATHNEHFSSLLMALGTRSIPRVRLAEEADASRLAYLRRVNGEHDNIYDAIAAGDAEAARAAMRTHLANSRERRRRLEEQIGAGGIGGVGAPAGS
jgi:DNA-binding FadR family transcriptional regulator